MPLNTVNSYHPHDHSLQFLAPFHLFTELFKNFNSSTSSAVSWTRYLTWITACYELWFVKGFASKLQNDSDNDRTGKFPARATRQSGIHSPILNICESDIKFLSPSCIYKRWHGTSQIISQNTHSVPTYNFSYVSKFLIQFITPAS